MDLVVKLIIGIAQAMLATLQIAMLIRAILSWLPISDDNIFVRFVTMLTEPIVAPIRALFERMNWFQNIPIDISFLVAYILLSVVSTVLGVVA
ncbi:MAG: YggT family protein [Clostridia bacterium]|nr:YggT family protein [Clostridia bacterium]MBQ8717272.1 YggT family protein [Clostridia bacterium]